MRGSLAVVAALFLLSSIVCATDWPMFMHDLNHTGFSGDSVNATTFALNWSYSTGAWISSSPAVAGGSTVYAFIPSGSTTQSISLTLGWNLISIPLA